VLVDLTIRKAASRSFAAGSASAQSVSEAIRQRTTKSSQWPLPQSFTDLTRREIIAAALLVISLLCLIAIQFIDRGMWNMADELWQDLLDTPHIHLTTDPHSAY
jgi:hypothetical protein